MRLYSTKIPSIASDLVKTLSEGEALSVLDKNEAELDVQAVLKEYLRLEREVTESAKKILEEKNLSYDQFGRVKKTVAREKGFGFGEDGLDWMTTQIIETFLNSPHIEEVFGDDNTLRRTMTQVLRKYMQADEDLDEEVRRRIKNLEEGTATWEVEYNRALEQIKRNRGME